jgi:hypothetical protein
VGNVPQERAQTRILTQQPMMSRRNRGRE